MKKTNLKIYLCLVLTAIVAFSLFACGNRAQNSPDTGKDDVKTTENTPETKPPEVNGGNAENLPSREDFFAQDQLVIYPELPEPIRRNYDYKVTVTQGDKSAGIPVYNHTMEYDAPDRAIGGDLYRRFSQFAFSGEKVRVDIAVNQSFEYYSVFPSAKNFETEYHDGVISVYLDKPDYFGIRLDDDDNSILSVFADLPEYPGDIPKKDDPRVIWVEGWKDVEGGILYLKEENTTLYIAPGAVLNSRLDIRGANSKVLGRGVILDPFENIYKLDIRNGGTETHGVMLCQLYSNGGEFDGPVLIDTRAYNLMTGSNVKLLGNVNYAGRGFLFTRREIIRDNYKRAVAEGDKNVYFVDGESLFEGEMWDTCTVDGAHPNDLGFFRIAQVIGKVLKKALKI